MNLLKRLLNMTPSSTTLLTVTSNNGFHLRPIAKFVNEVKKFDAKVMLIANKKEVSATQVPNILSLSLEKGSTFTLKCKGKEAKKASKALSSFFVTLMEEEKEVKKILQVAEAYEASALKGETIAKGIAIAPLVPLKRVEHVKQNTPISLREAIAKTKEALLTHYEQNRQNESSEIFLAQKELLSSKLFERNFSNLQEFQSIINDEIEKLKNSKFASRIADYKDLQQKVLEYLGIYKEFELPLFPYILVANSLLPSDIEKLKKTPIKGVVLQNENSTSHASILLRSANIPSLIIQESPTQSRNTILDANAGYLILTPTQQDIKKAMQKQKEFMEALDKSFENRFNLTQTRSGKPIKVLANITDLNSAKEAKNLGADGIGLLRTEFLFTNEKPTLTAQTLIYQEIFELFEEVTIRTLDIGGDKSLPYISIEKEENPFLGIRGIRFSLQEQTLFKEQLLAIFKATHLSTSEKNIKIMFPMVSSIEEFIEAKTIAKTIAHQYQLDISHIQFGIMIEVPSILFGLKAFDELVDFYSIGSNDLTQYLFAIERTHRTLKVDTNSPLLMEALRYIFNNTQKPISICGELAGVETSTKSLLEMGYNTLSVSAKLIPSLKERIRNV